MSANASTFYNSSLQPPTFSCASSPHSFFIFIGFVVAKAFLLLPLSILILILGYQRWRQRRSSATANHSDFFTYHLSVVELIGLFGAALFCSGKYIRQPLVMIVGYCISSIALPGQALFHCLTCVERHLAVVHPVTYLRLKNSGGVRIRNISIGCVWALSFGWIGLVAHYLPNIPASPLVCLLTVSLIVVSFCSLSVLYVLIRPRPGEVAGERGRVDQSKQRALRTIMAITGVLLLWITGILLSVALESAKLLKRDDICVVQTSAIWFSLPSSLVSPLLFLHKTGKLTCSRYSD